MKPKETLIDYEPDFEELAENREALGEGCVYDEYVICSPSCSDWERCGYIEREA
jgi:hypothetical protein